MAKIRIHELAKELVQNNPELDAKTLSADIVKQLQDAGSDVKTHMSSISDEEAASIRDKYAPKGNKAASEQKTARASENPAASAKSEAESRNMSGDRNGSNQSAKPVQGGNKAKRPIEGKLVGRDGKTINYRVAADGMLVDMATGKNLPFRMGPDGRIMNKDGKVLQRKPADGKTQQGRPEAQERQNRPAQKPPVSQVFDGRSEKDKRIAANNANQNRGSNQKGALTSALGDKIKAFEGQLDTSQTPVQPKVKKPKQEIQLPVMPKEDKTEENQIPVSVEEVKQPEPVAEEVKPQEKPAEAPATPFKIIDNIFANRTATNTNQSSGNRDTSRTDRQQGQGYNRDGQRPYGDRQQGQGNRDGQHSYGDRQQGQGNRDGQRSYGDRQQGQGYNRDGQRSYGDRQQGQGNRDGQRSYGDRQQGQGYNRDGQRPYGDRQQGQGYNRDGQRPYGDRQQGQGNRDGQRPYGDRQQGQGNRDGQRPYGDRQQGQGYNRDNRRSYGDGAQGQGGFGDKDKDDNQQRRSYPRKNDQKSSGGSIKTELANELGKNNRAANIKDRKNYKTDKRDRSDYEEDEPKKGIKKTGKGALSVPEKKPVVEEETIKTIEVGEVITVKELANKMKQPAPALIKKFLLAGKMYNLNSELSFEEAEEIALEYEIICEKEVKVNIVEELLKDTEEAPETLVKRPPVVCVMGHVDHGKTSLLDAIRKTNVTAREAGGITQHIGAYMVEINGEKITFLDTPGHEAFTSMRMRGAQSTDIAILVVAADDGVMPQTVEAISHAKAAGVSIIVAVNKIDKPGANIDRVKQELTEHQLVAEDWGGDTVLVPVSAKTGEGIENLLEMVLLTADVLELKANPNRNARGIVIEAKLDKGRGPVATVLVQKGTLKVGDTVAIGAVHGKVRAMTDDKGRKVKVATPSTPVELLGLNGVPQAGEVMMSVEDEKEARTIAEAFIAQSKEQLIAESKKNVTLDSLFSQIQEGDVKDLNLIIKADVMGSVEAVKQSLLKLSNEEVAVRVIHGGVGNINESDVTLAAASGAIIIGFNVKPDNAAKDTADHEKVDVRLYRVIYDAINDIEAAMKGMLKPIYQEKIIGHAEVRQLFKASGVGIIAGAFVLDGKIVRGASARITREGKQIWEGALASLKRFKDDVKEVAAGYECGLVFEKYSDLAELDQVEFYIMEEVPRK